MTSALAIGAPAVRVDGRHKVTGAARYSADVHLEGLAYAVLVGARVPSGRITRIDTTEAQESWGVHAILTHQNLPKIAAQPPLLPVLAVVPTPGQSFFPLQDEVIHYFGQPVALVVADTLERAQHAAALIRIDYEQSPPVTTLEQGRDHAYEPEAIFGGFIPGRDERGDVNAGLVQADVRVDATYTYAANNHNPIEPSATTAAWDGDRLTLYDATQSVASVQVTVAALLGLTPSKVRVISHFVGGSFGCKASTWAHPVLAALAARQVRRPVELCLTREQMFTSVGHREEQEQRITLGATGEGRLTALRHHKLSPTSPFDDWAEPSLGVASRIYACPNYEGVYRLFRASTMTPTFMRAPGEATGMFALESTMDDLAHQLGIDPVELRLRNYADIDPTTGNPWSSSGLKECYQRGAERFGWQRRNPEPRSHRDGRWLVGYGMATAGYLVFEPVNPQRARARLYADGTAVVQAATPDFGTGVATVMTQVVADALGISPERCRFEGGDTTLPTIALAAASAGAGMISAAVHTAATNLRDQLVARAIADPRSPLHGAAPSTVVVDDGRMALRGRPETGESYGELLDRKFLPDVEAVGVWSPAPEAAEYGMMTFGAQFAEVAVDPDLGLVRVRHMVGAFAPGRVLNPLTTRSQLMGGMLWGLGQALLEANYMDPRRGRWVASSLGDYLVPVNADAPEVDIELIEVEDKVVNPLGVKGVGEIGQVGAAAAIANAVHHATGRRIRKLPITIEDLL
ncbi:xanthine dehydrogenase family protein molybdopterin-binding subunit [Streptomyces sp. NPDC051286]|uniref:xanthine dehydrogenase family protein molybdopterin-binding subunit n=1 Tax=Streptomyces sp. NPDC051286 TaxID=3365647 RepID=UPI0037941EEB